MPRLSRSQETARQRIMQLASQTLLPEELGARLLSALQAAIPADRQALFGVDPVSLLFNRLLAVNTGNLDATLYWLKNIYLAREPTAEITFPGLMQANVSTLVIHDRIETSYGLPSHLLNRLTPQQYYRAYHDIGTPSGGILSAVYAVDTQWVAASAFLRWNPAQPFHPGDISFLRLVAPTIGRALRSALDYERALTNLSHPRPDRAGVFLLGRDGRVQFSTPAAEMWSDLLLETELGRKGLPTAVLSAVARLRAGSDVPAPPLVRVATRLGVVRVEASLGGDGDSTGIVFVPENIPSCPEIPSSWPVTPRERQVAELLVRGLSNHQIAAQLVVSENTLGTHLRHMYEKLDVAGRNQLLARLFSDAYWSGLRSPQE